MKLMKKISLIVSFVFLVPFLCAGSETPQRVVSLAPSITESLYSLGQEEKLVAVTSYCDYPDETKDKKVIGNVVNPNIEKIFSLSPDLILSAGGINRSQTIAKLKSLGLTVVVLETCNSFDDVIRNFDRLGSLMGAEAAAKEITEKVGMEIRSITERLEDVPSVSVFWEVEANPLIGVGGRSFANEFIWRSGGVNIFADASVMYPRVSREEVLRRNPEVIVLVTMGNVTAKEKMYWRKFKDIDAVKDDRIYVIDGNKVCRPTPVSFLTGLKEVATLLHPEVFGKKE